MSLAGYLAGDSGELRMGKDMAAETGIRTEGAVLAGKASVEERLAGVPAGRVGGREVVYRDVEDYDPVLRSHCRV